MLHCTIFPVTIFSLKRQLKTSLGTLSKAFSRSTKVHYFFLFPSNIFSYNCLSMNTTSIVPLPGLNPNWLSCLGPSIKYVTLKGEGVREGVTVCDKGEGVKSM